MQLVYLLTSYHGIALGLFILISKHRRKLSNRVLALALLSFSISLVEITWDATFFKKYTHLAVVSDLFLFLNAPLLFCYVYVYVKGRFRYLAVTTLLVLVPAVVYFIDSHDFFLLDAASKLAVINNDQYGQYFTHRNFFYHPILMINVCCMGWSLGLLFRSEQEKTYKTYIIISLCIFVVADALLGYLNWMALLHDLSLYNKHFSLVTRTLLIQIIGYMTISFEGMLEGRAKNRTATEPKYETSTMSLASSKKLMQKLDVMMMEEKIFKMDSVSLHMLAERMKVTENAISQSFSRSGTNFYAWLNDKRVRHAINMLEAGKHQTLTLQAIAYESGFQSKPTFNRAFKKVTGLTPTQYIDQKLT